MMSSHFRFLFLSAMLCLTACQSALGTQTKGLEPQAALSFDYWQPNPFDSFNIQLDGTIREDQFDTAFVELDLFDTDNNTIAALQNRGIHVACYFSAGSWENWRPDASSFPEDLIGKPYAGWPGEKWLDIRQLDRLQTLLTSRIQLCAEKGFNSMEADNLDGFENQTGFPITYEDQLVFNRWLAKTAHANGLSIALKNNPLQAGTLQEDFDWALLESCFSQGWCQDFSSFIEAGKAVYVIEYQWNAAARQKYCRQAIELGVELIFKNRSLDSFTRYCPD